MARETDSASNQDGVRRRFGRWSGGCDQRLPRHPGGTDHRLCSNSSLGRNTEQGVRRRDRDRLFGDRERVFPFSTPAFADESDFAGEPVTTGEIFELFLLEYGVTADQLNRQFTDEMLTVYVVSRKRRMRRTEPHSEQHSSQAPQYVPRDAFLDVRARLSAQGHNLGGGQSSMLDGIKVKRVQIN